MVEQEKTLMTQGPIGRILLRFALPLFLGNLFQQLYNTVDSLVVGNFSGNEALAAVSSSGSLCFLIIGFFQGVFAGASVVISRRYGARDGEGVDRAVHATVIFSLAAGLLLTVLGVGFTPAILRWIGTPENVMPDSVLYFRIYCSGLLGLVLYNTANGIFQALGDSRHPLYYLIVSSVVNVVLDLLFVAVWDMGVAGAALATVIGQCLSALLGFLHLMSGRFLVRVSLRRLRADPTVLGLIFRLGLPSGVQNSVIAIANVVVQSHINAFGDNAMAGCGSYFKVEGFVFLPITCLTLAMTTFVSQNLGAQRYDRVKEGARLGTLMTVGLSEAVGVAVFLVAPFLIGAVYPRSRGDRLRRPAGAGGGSFLLYAGVSHSAASILRGAGRAVIPMAVMLAVWCVFRIS